MRKNIGISVLLFILVANLFLRIWGYRQEFLTKFDPAYWQGRYLKSQWVDPMSKEPIGDDGLYAYAGWAYIHGRDPTVLNAEMPPLGKYLIGLSSLIFGNQNIFSLAVGILVLFAFYKLNLLFLKDKFWSLLPIVLFSFEPLYYQQLRAPYLDTLYLLFLLLSFYYFLKKNFLVTNIFLGMMVLTKNSVSTFILLESTFFLFLLIKREKIFPFFKNLPVSIFVFLVGYTRYFWLGHSLHEFLGVQKWILNFYAVGAKGTLGMVFPMFFNRWQTWWNGIIKINEWQITWPILFLLSIFHFLYSIFQKQFNQYLLIWIWLVIYILFLMLIPVWPRYFLLIIPFLYLMATDLVKSRLRNIIK